MNITFESVMADVANSRTMSRKDKQIAINQFLKKHSGPNKPTSEDQLATLEALKAIKKNLSKMDALDKAKDKV